MAITPQFQRKSLEGGVDHQSITALGGNHERVHGRLGCLLADPDQLPDHGRQLRLVDRIPKRKDVAPGDFIRELAGIGDQPTPIVRSEEHTSELQSLMRISYAVFCLKKKKKN